MEINGLSIPIVEWDVIHELNKCRIETRKLKDRKDVLEEERGKIAMVVGEAPVRELVKLNPMVRQWKRLT